MILVDKIKVQNKRMPCVRINNYVYLSDKKIYILGIQNKNMRLMITLRTLKTRSNIIRNNLGDI